MKEFPPFTPQERELFNSLGPETVRFLRRRYNRITRWVVATRLLPILNWRRP
jgi:hypothetical protein